MATSVGASPGGTGRPARAQSWALLAGVLAVGLVVGGVLGALFAGGADDGSTGAAPSSAPSSASATSTSTDVEVRVDEACLRALDAARQAYDALDGVGQALADLDAARLDEIVHRLQPLQQQVSEGTDDCRVVTRFPNGSAVSEQPPAPSSSPPSPSPSPGG
jgi:hypothetical protein